MARERILLIEDEPDIAEVLQYNLEKEGFGVELAHRGDTGLESLRRQAPDLILLDLMLPGVDGLELTRLLKRDAATSRIPIVMLTARGEEVDRIVGLELGADDYISKPFSPREVVLRVKVCSAGSSTRRPPATSWRSAASSSTSPATSSGCAARRCR
jgi:DNA-binding response OmpR family regulator